MHCYITSIYTTTYLECDDDQYEAISSDDAGGPSFEWISAKDLGTKIPLNNFTGFYGGSPRFDGSAANRPVGFAFPFYGASFTEVTIGVNGGMSFSSPDISVLGLQEVMTIPGATIGDFISP